MQLRKLHVAITEQLQHEITYVTSRRMLSCAVQATVSSIYHPRHAFITNYKQASTFIGKVSLHHLSGNTLVLK